MDKSIYNILVVILQVFIQIQLIQAQCSLNCILCDNQGYCKACEVGFTLSDDENKCVCIKGLFYDSIQNRCVSICSENYYSNDTNKECNKAPSCSLNRIFGDNLNSNENNQSLAIKKLIYIEQLNYIIGIQENDNTLIIWNVQNGIKVYSYKIFADGDYIEDLSIYRSSIVDSQTGIAGYYSCLLVQNSKQNIFVLISIRNFQEVLRKQLSQQQNIHNQWRFKYIENIQQNSITFYITTTNRFDGDINIIINGSNENTISLSQSNQYILYDLHPINGNLLIFYSSYIEKYDLPYQNLTQTIQSSYYNQIKSIDKIWRSDYDQIFIVAVNQQLIQVLAFMKDSSCIVGLEQQYLNIHIFTQIQDNQASIMVVHNNLIQVYLISSQNGTSFCKVSSGLQFQINQITRTFYIGNFILYLSLSDYSVNVLKIDNQLALIDKMYAFNKILDSSINNKTELKFYLRSNSTIQQIQSQFNSSLIIILSDNKLRVYEISSLQPSSTLVSYPQIMRYEQNHQCGFSKDAKDVQIFQHFQFLDGQQEEFVLHISKNGYVHKWTMNQYLINPEYQPLDGQLIMGSGKYIMKIQLIDQNNLFVITSEGNVLVIDSHQFITQASLKIDKNIIGITILNQSNSIVIIYLQQIQIISYDISAKQILSFQSPQLDSSNYIYSFQYQNKQDKFLICYEQKIILLSINNQSLNKIAESSTPFQVSGCHYSNEFNLIIIWSIQSYQLVVLDSSSLQQIGQISLVFTIDQAISIQTHCNKQLKLISPLEFLCLIQTDKQQNGIAYDLIYYVNFQEKKISQLLKYTTPTIYEVVHFENEYQNMENAQSDYTTIYLQSYKNLTQFSCKIQQYVLNKKICLSTNSCLFQYKQSYFTSNLELQGNCDKIIFSNFQSQFLTYNEKDGTLLQSSNIQRAFNNKESISLNIQDQFERIHLVSKLFLLLLESSIQLKIYEMISLTDIKTILFQQNEKLIEVYDVSEFNIFFILTNMRIIRITKQFNSSNFCQFQFIILKLLLFNNYQGNLDQWEKPVKNIIGLILYRQIMAVIGYGERLAIFLGIAEPTLTEYILELNINNDITSITYSKLDCIGVQSQILLICTIVQYDQNSINNISLFSFDLVKKQFIINLGKLDITSYTKMIHDPSLDYLLIFGSSTFNIYSAKTGVLLQQQELMKNIIDIYLTKNKYFIISEIYYIIFEKSNLNSPITVSFLGSYLGSSLLENVNAISIFTTNTYVGPYLLININTGLRLPSAIPLEKTDLVQKMIYDENTNTLYVQYQTRFLQAFQIQSTDTDSEWKILFHPIFTQQQRVLGFYLDKYLKKILLLSYNYLVLLDTEQELSSYSNQFKTKQSSYTSYQIQQNYSSQQKYFLDYNNQIWIQQADSDSSLQVLQNINEKIINIDMFKSIDPRLMVYSQDTLFLYLNNGSFSNLIKIKLFRIFKINSILQNQDTIDLKHIIITKDSKIVTIDQSYKNQIYQKPLNCYNIIDAYQIQQFNAIFIICSQLLLRDNLIYFFYTNQSTINIAKLTQIEQNLISLNTYNLSKAYILSSSGQLTLIANDQSLSVKFQTNIQQSLNSLSNNFEQTYQIDTRIFITFINSKLIYIIDLEKLEQYLSQGTNLVYYSQILSHSTFTKQMLLHTNYTIIYSLNMVCLYFISSQNDNLSFILKDILYIQSSNTFQNVIQIIDNDLILIIDSSQICTYQILLNAPFYQNYFFNQIQCFKSSSNLRFYEKMFFVQSSIFLKLRLVFDNNEGQMIIKDIFISNIDPIPIDSSSSISQNLIIPNLNGIKSTSFISGQSPCIHQLQGVNVYELLRKSAQVDYNYQLPYLDIFINKSIRYHPYIVSNKTVDVIFRGVNNEISVDRNNWKSLQFKRFQCEKIILVLYSFQGGYLQSDVLKQLSLQSFILSSNETIKFEDLYLQNKQRTLKLIEGSYIEARNIEIVNQIGNIIKDIYFRDLVDFFQYINITNINIRDLVVDSCVFTGISNFYYFQNVTDISLVNITFTNNIFIQQYPQNDFSFFKFTSCQVIIFEHFNIKNNKFVFLSSEYRQAKQYVFMIRIIGVQQTQIQNGNIQDNIGFNILQTKNEVDEEKFSITKQKDQLIFTNFTVISNTNEDEIQTGFYIYQNSLFELSSSSIRIIGSTFSKNSCILCQGSIRITESRDVQIKNCYFIMNYAYNGGSLKIKENKNSVIIENSIFSGNIALFSGGALFSQNSNIIIQNDCKFTNNTALVGGAIRQIGDYSLLELSQSDINIIFQQNKGFIYGDNIGYYPFRVKMSIFIQGTDYEITQENIGQYGLFKSGQLLDIQIRLFDYYDQSILLEESSKYPFQQYQKLIIEREFQSQNIKILTSVANSQALETITVEGAKIIDSYDSFDKLSNSFIFTDIQLSGIFNQCGYLTIYSDMIVEDFQYMAILKKETQQNQDYYLAKTQVCIRQCNIGEIPKLLYQNYYVCMECGEGFYSKLNYTNYFNKTSYNFQYNQDMKCQKCPGSADSCKGSQIVMADGYWRENVESDRIFKCQKNILFCKGDKNTQQKGYCLQGYLGPLCEGCDTFGVIWGDRYFAGEDKQCLLCSQKEFVIAITIVFIALLSFYIKFNSLMYYKSSQKNSLCYYLRMLRILPFSATQYRDLNAALSKSLIHYLQISVIFDFYSVEIPLFFSGFLTFFSNPSIWISYGLDCIIPKRYKEDLIAIRLVFVLSIPIVLLIIQFAILGVQVALRIYNSHRAYNSSYTITFLIMGFYLSNITRQFLYKKYFISSLLCMKYSFLAENLSCKKLGDDYYQLFDNKINCAENNHNWRLASWISLAFWSFIPLFVAIKMQKHKNQLQSTIIKYKYGFFYLDFNKKYYYWETIRTFIRVYLVVSYKLLQAYENIRRVQVIAVIFIYLFIVAKRNIFRNTLLQNLEVWSLKIIIAQITSGFIIDYQFAGTNIVISILMQSIHYSFVIYSVFLIIKYSLLSVNIIEYPLINKLIKFLLPLKFYNYLINNVFIKSNFSTLKRWKWLYKSKSIITKLNSYEVFNLHIHNNDNKTSSNTGNIAQPDNIRNKSITWIKRENNSMITQIKSKINMMFSEENKLNSQKNLKSKTYIHGESNNGSPTLPNYKISQNETSIIQNTSKEQNQPFIKNGFNHNFLIELHSLSQLNSQKPSNLNFTDYYKENASPELPNYQFNSRFSLRKNQLISNDFTDQTDIVSEVTQQHIFGKKEEKLFQNIISRKSSQSSFSISSNSHTKKCDESIASLNPDQLDIMNERNEIEKLCVFEENEIPTAIQIMQRQPQFQNIEQIKNQSHKNGQS